MSSEIVFSLNKYLSSAFYVSTYYSEDASIKGGSELVNKP